MTTAQAQAARTKAARTKLLIMMASLPLLGCVAPSKSVYSIDGAATDFCVPRTLDVTPARLNQGKIIQGGVTINGCWRESGGECIGPENLISLSVTDKRSFIGRRFKDFPSDAYVRMSASQERRGAKSLSNKLIAIPDGENAKKWFVWYVVEPHQEKMAADDELEVTCVEKADVGGYLCNRKITGKDYLLGYSFVSQKELPAAFNSLDRLVVAEIEKFRCPKNVSLP